MKYSMKKAVRYGIPMITIGVVIVVIAILSVGFDWSKLDNQRYEKKTYTVSEDFTDISIEGKTEDICFALSEDNSCRIVAKEQKNFTYNIEVVDGKLTITEEDSRKWYEKMVVFSFGWEEVKMTVYLPKNEYESLFIKTKNSDIKISDNFTFHNTDITSASGDIDIKKLRGDNLCVRTSSGDVELSDVRAEDRIEIKTTSGDVELHKSDADALSITTTSGDVECSLLTGKKFITSSKIGDIHVPDSASGGDCEIHTKSGDITVKVKK